jgi:hypothetical protein
MTKYKQCPRCEGEPVGYSGDGCGICAGDGIIPIEEDNES